MLRIGEFSKLAKTTVKTLRFYDEIGLFKPEFVDDNGYRYYDIEQLNALQKIVALRSIDMPLDSIAKIMSGSAATPIFEDRLKELEAELNRNRKNISLIKQFMAKAEKGDFMNHYTAEQITLPRCVVYYRKGVIANMSGLFTFVLEAGEEVKRNNPTLKCAQPEYCFVCYSANEYKETDVELEYAEAVEGFGKESENIRFKQLEEQRAVSVKHRGSYSKLNEAYAFAVNWVKENGFEIAAPIRECYIDGCWNKDNEDDYLTEIQIPVK